MRAKLYWSKEITPDGKSNPEEYIKRMKNKKVNILIL